MPPNRRRKRPPVTSSLHIIRTVIFSLFPCCLADILVLSLTGEGDLPRRQDQRPAPFVEDIQYVYLSKHAPVIYDSVEWDLGQVINS